MPILSTIVYYISKTAQIVFLNTMKDLYCNCEGSLGFANVDSRSACIVKAAESGRVVGGDNI